MVMRLCAVGLVFCWRFFVFFFFFNLYLSVPFLWSPGLVSEVRQVSVNFFGQTQFDADTMFWCEEQGFTPEQSAIQVEARQKGGMT